MTPERVWDDDLVESAPCGFVVLDAKGDLIQVNATFLEWTGYTAEQLIGKLSWQELLPVGDRIFWGTHCAPLLALQGAAMELSMTVKRHDGTRLPALVNMRARATDGVERVLLTLFDATDRTSYEKELRLARDEARRSEERLRSLSTFTAGLIRTPTAAEIAHRLADTALVVLDAGWTMVWLVDDDLLVPASSPHFDAASSEAIRLDDTHPVAESCRSDASRSRFVASSDVIAGGVVTEHDLDTETVLVPLRVDAAVFGTAAFTARSSGPPIDADFIDALTLQAAHALERAHSQSVEADKLDHVTRLASTDPLTGLANRRAFLDAWSPLLSSDAEHGVVVLAMIDIDHFKAVNDTHGHDVGDQVLIEVAQRLAAATRRGGVLARWGGEEFIMACRADHDDAGVLTERLRRSVCGEPVRLDDDTELLVSVSVGVAVGIGEAGTVEEFQQTADDALYQAKRNGRNQVCVSPLPR